MLYCTMLYYSMLCCNHDGEDGYQAFKKYLVPVVARSLKCHQLLVF